MKKILIGFLSLMLAIAVVAEEKKDGKTNILTDDAAVAISGTVLDSASGELLVGVEVTLEGTEAKTYTDFDGNFSFKNLQPGEYKLVTNYISYKNSSEKLKVDQGKNDVNIKLETSN